MSGGVDMVDGLLCFRKSFEEIEARIKYLENLRKEDVCNKREVDIALKELYWTLGLDYKIKVDKN